MSIEISPLRCARCSNPCNVYCSGCRAVTYCDKKCQRADRPRHAPDCRNTAPLSDANVIRTALEKGRAYGEGKLESHTLAQFHTRIYRNIGASIATDPEFDKFVRHAQAFCRFRCHVLAKVDIIRLWPRLMAKRSAMVYGHQGIKIAFLTATVPPEFSSMSKPLDFIFTVHECAPQNGEARTFVCVHFVTPYIRI